MKRFLLSMLVALLTLSASAKIDVDFSSRFDEGTNTITAPSGWGWYTSAGLSDNYEIMECDYLYIKYSSSFNFNLIIQDMGWQNAYVVNCSSTDNEAYIKLTPGAFPGFTQVVIQNHSEGSIDIEKLYFCSEEEFYNPAPDDLEGARANLMEIYMRYQKLQDKYVAGTGFGNYPEELVQAFNDALNAALILDGNEGQDLTVEQLNAMSQAIVDAYRALEAGQIRYLPANGYYRFVGARMYVNGSEEYGYNDVVKAMYSTNTGDNGWNTLDVNDPTYLWTIERQDDGNYLLQNASSKLNFTSAEKCTDGVKYIAFDALTKPEGGYDLGYTLSTDGDVTVFNFRLSDQAAGDKNYVHMNWHNGGTGWNGPMTTWCNSVNDSGATEWYLQPVDEEVAKALLDETAYERDFVVMLADAKEKLSIADDKTLVKLITEASQFSSPFSQNDLGSKDGDNLRDGVLINGKTDDFWHSVWSAGNVEAGLHYLQIEMPEEITGDIRFDFTRRIANDDNVTKWGIYGSNAPEGEKYDYEWIADIETPYNVKGESVSTSFSIDSDKSYRYLRFYAEATNSNRGYWHVSEFQLYQAFDNPNNQASKMGDIYANLKSAVERADAVEEGALTKADYEALKAAYDPFIAMFVDPTDLRKLINEAEPVLKLYAEGNNPGQWSEDPSNGLGKDLADAKAYDQAGAYTQAQTDAFIEALTDAEAKFLNTANKISTKKYYAIRFASEEMYEEFGWSTSNVLSETSGDLFNNYLCSIKAEEDPEAEGSEEAQEPGINLIFSDNSAADIEFFFVPAGDNLYTIKHKATGRYIHVNGYDSWTNLTSEPTTFFTVEAVGHGENIIHATDNEGNDLSYLHAQLSDHRLVTWHDHYAGSNSGLMLEELGDISEEDAIANVEQASAKTANIYNVAGQLVRKNAKQNDVKSLSKGLYIMNGTKVLVK